MGKLNKDLKTSNKINNSNNISVQTEELCKHIIFLFNLIVYIRLAKFMKGNLDFL